MSDDGTERTSAGDASEGSDGDSSDPLEPSGGPQRVVSGESVDDILDSLAETESEASESTEPNGSVTTEFDEGDLPDVDATEPGSGTDTDGAKPETNDVEELAARIEDGTVTGADVRAAEAGTGRESTPDVGEIDLSMDDLESTEGGTSGSAMSDDEGDDSSESGRDDATGLLGRIKRLFGG